MAARILLAALLLACGAAAAETRLQVFETHPASPAVLGHWEQFQLRVGYTTDRPVRIFGEPYAGSEKAPGMSSTSFLYGPGAGEALYWIAYTKPARVDRIVVYAQDEKGQRVASTEVAVRLEWTGQPAAAPRAAPAWVGRLEAERNALQKAASDARAREPVNWAWVIAFQLAALSIPASLVLQVLLLLRWRGGWRLAALASGVPMAGFFAHAVLAFFAGSNIFPLLLFFFCPPALAYLLVLLGLRKSRLGAFLA